MPRFFIDGSRVENGEICLTERDAHHVRDVLRMTAGDILTLCDGAGCDYLGEISKLTGGEVTVKILSGGQNIFESACRITLFTALMKSGKNEQVIQKSIELGAHKIVLFPSKHCVVKLDEKSAGAKLARYSKIAEAAAKQCGRGMIPKVSYLPSFKDAVQSASDSSFACALFLNESEHAAYMRDVFEEHARFDSISILSGPEGGFSEGEIVYARERLKSISLGPRILRCETAPLMALTIALYECRGYEHENLR